MKANNTKKEKSILNFPLCVMSGEGSSAPPLPLVSPSGAATSPNATPKTASQYVKLNVGGCLFHTTIGTLTKHDNMLRAMFSGRMELLTDAEGNKFNKFNQI